MNHIITPSDKVHIRRMCTVQFEANQKTLAKLYLRIPSRIASGKFWNDFRHLHIDLISKYAFRMNVRGMSMQCNAQLST